MVSLKSLIEWGKESDTAKQAHEMGLTSGGFNRWVDKDGNTVAKTVNGKLVKLEPKNKDAPVEKKPSYWEKRREGEKALLQQAAKEGPEAVARVKRIIWGRNNPEAQRSQDIKQHFDRRKTDPEYNKQFEPVDTTFDW